MYSSNETILEVDLNKLKHNYYYLKSLLKNDCKIIAVVKAFAYGHGDVVISKTLEGLGVDTFWVADFEEGIRQIRDYMEKAGIKKAVREEIDTILKLANEKLSGLPIDKDKLLYFSDIIKKRGY